MRYAVIVAMILAIGAIPEPQMCVAYLECPSYPRLARQAQFQDTVTMNIEINERGEVVAVVAEAKYPLLRKEAEDNIRTWKFRHLPAGSAYPIKHTVVFEFKLEGERVAYQPYARVSFDLPDRVRIVTQPMTPQPSK